jgi:Ser/Thr protein kinase RdoA (MazF antagonist)
MMWLIALRNDSSLLVPKVLPAKDGPLVKTIHKPDLAKPMHTVVYSFLPGIEPTKSNHSMLTEACYKFVKLISVDHLLEARINTADFEL